MKNYREAREELPTVDEIRETCIEIFSHQKTYKRSEILNLLQKHFDLTDAQMDLRQAQNSSTMRIVDGRLLHVLQQWKETGYVVSPCRGYWRKG